MYRGVIQHSTYVSEYLRGYVERQGLGPPGATGRIWRVVREGRAIAYSPPALRSVEAQLEGLDHPNGWVRDRAQRRIVFERDPEALSGLRDLAARTARGRLHTLWALDALGAIDPETWSRLVRDEEASVRRAALQVGSPAAAGSAAAFRERLVSARDDTDPSVRLQALHSLGDLPAEERPLELLLAAGRAGDALQRQAVLSGLRGLEVRALEAELAGIDTRGTGDWDWLGQLATAVYAAEADSEARATLVAGLFDELASRSGKRSALAIAEGMQAAQRLPGSERVTLASPPALYEGTGRSGGSAAFERALTLLRLGVTWPGDPSPGGARALTAEERARRERGAELFAATCATCHGRDGRGNPGLAPPLAGSSWVRDSDAWLVRIVLGGLAGPIEVAGESWDRVMPGHAADPRFDDETLAGLLTHLRRSWGHADEPVAPATVAAIREQARERNAPWTAEALLALEIEHRLDRYTGIYRIPVVGIEVEVAREGTTLTVGRPGGASGPLLELAGGLFQGEGLSLRFDPFERGRMQEVELTQGTTTITARRVRATH